MPHEIAPEPRFRPGRQWSNYAANRTSAMQHTSSYESGRGFGGFQPVVSRELDDDPNDDDAVPPMWAGLGQWL